MSSQYEFRLEYEVELQGKGGVVTLECAPRPRLAFGACNTSHDMLPFIQPDDKSSSVSMSR